MHAPTMKIYPKAATLPGKEGAHLQEVWLYLQKIFYPFLSQDMNSNSPNRLPHIYYNVSSEKIWCQNQNKYPS